jgi:hypothetical protein
MRGSLYGTFCGPILCGRGLSFGKEVAASTWSSAMHLSAQGGGLRKNNPWRSGRQMETEVMDRAVLLIRLAQIKRHIDKSQQQIRQQSVIVAGLDEYGRDSTKARQLLTQFDEMLAFYITDRDQLLRELRGNE